MNELSHPFLTQRLRRIHLSFLEGAPRASSSRRVHRRDRTFSSRDKLFPGVAGINNDTIDMQIGCGTFAYFSPRKVIAKRERLHLISSRPLVPLLPTRARNFTRSVRQAGEWSSLKRSAAL